MFAVIKRFMFGIRRVVWLHQSLSDPRFYVFLREPEPKILNVWHKFNPLRLFHSVHMLMKYKGIHRATVRSPVCAFTPRHAGGAYINVHGDGYESSNHLNDECCLPASSWSVLSCGTLRWGQRGCQCATPSSYYTHATSFHTEKKHQTFKSNKHKIPTLTCTLFNKYATIFK